MQLPDKQSLVRTDIAPSYMEPLTTIKSCLKAKMTISSLDYRVSKASQSIAKLHVCENFLVEEVVNTLIIGMKLAKRILAAVNG